MSEFPSSSGGNKSAALAEHWKKFVATLATSSSASIASTGSEQTVLSQSTALEIGGYGFYGIADDVDEIAVEGGNAGVMTLDCISVQWFWETLLANIKLYKPLQYESVTEEETTARNELLKAIAPVVQEGKLPNRRMVLIFIPPKGIPDVSAVFPPGKWINVDIECADAAASDATPFLETDPATLSAPRYVVTHSLYDEFVREANKVERRRELVPEETAFLEEVFSLNHVPDVDLGEGSTTPPPAPVPAPIVLDEGGFTFDGDADFWSKAVLWTRHRLDETTIRQGGEPEKALHRTTEVRYNVVAGDETADEFKYALTLETEDGEKAFELSVAPGSGEIVVECVLPVTAVDVEQRSDGVVVVTKEEATFWSDEPVPDLFDPPSNSNSSGKMPPTPKKATRRTPIDRENLDGVTRTLFGTKTNPKEVEKGKSASNSNSNEADKENIHPNLVNVGKLQTLRASDGTTLHLSPKKNFWGLR